MTDEYPRVGAASGVAVQIRHSRAGSTSAGVGSECPAHALIVADVVASHGDESSRWVPGVAEHWTQKQLVDHSFVAEVQVKRAVATRCYDVLEGNPIEVLIPANAAHLNALPVETCRWHRDCRAVVYIVGRDVNLAENRLMRSLSVETEPPLATAVDGAPHIRVVHTVRGLA